jgi:hypothetical protein
MAQIRALNSKGIMADYDAELAVSAVDLKGPCSVGELAGLLSNLEKQTGRTYVCMSSPFESLHRVYDVSGDGYPLDVFGDNVKNILERFHQKSAAVTAEILLTAVS